MHTVVSKSPLLTAQLRAIDKDKEKGQAPVINVVLPANYGLPPPVVAQPLPVTPPQIQKPIGLIPPTLNEGPRMDINTFYAVYQLPDTVLQHFCDNANYAITGTHAFSHITETNLTGMGFKIGEVIDLNEAVRMWASLKGCF